MGQDKDALGDRMKDLESQETARRFMPGLPIYARIDGRGFSRFTKGMGRPFDRRMTDTMIATTKALVENTHATIGYVQSDEISLVWIPNERVDSTTWFDRKVMKMSSVLAGLATSAFMLHLADYFDDHAAMRAKLPHFDARVISMPNETEAANMLLWRNLDATKNAISMAASHYFSHKNLQGISGSEKQEMLFSKAGINFNDYPPAFKRGTWVRRMSEERKLTAAELARIPEKHRPDPDMMLVRTTVEAFDLPPLNRVKNRVEVLFECETPINID